MAENLSLRIVETENDLVELEKLAVKAHLNCGLHDRRLQWKSSPGTHLLVIDKNTQKVVGYFTGNYVRDDIYLSGHAYLKKQYRGRKTSLDLMPRMNSFMRPEISQDNIIVFHNCNGISLRSVICSLTGYVIGEKLLTYEGEVDRHKLLRFVSTSDNSWTNVTICFINCADDMEKLIAYDQSVHSLAAREKFMRLWCINDNIHAKTAIALSPQGYCVGFASLRLATNLIEPAYAVSDDIGLALLSTVLLTLPDKEIAQITFPGQNRAVLEFCSTLGWRSSITEHRVYNKKNIDLPWKNVYASNDFFLL